MAKSKLYNVARRYIDVIELMERTSDAQKLADLEEERVIWHNKLLKILKREGISFKDRESVTRLAYHLLRGNE
jgi:predicted methyltransferase